MSLCARCGMNEPLPTDPDDFCADCCAEVEAIVADIEERRRKAEYQRLEFLTSSSGFVSPQGLEEAKRVWTGNTDLIEHFPTTAPRGVSYSCDPCECGGNPDCPRCNP